MSLDIKELKCVNCGAPLPKPDSEFVTCEFCGFTQRVTDASSYLESIKGEIYGWLRNMIPTTGGVISQTLDPIARHNLFVYNVKPALIGEYIAKKNNLTMLLTSPLLFLPFIKLQDIPTRDSARNAFKDAAKLESLSPLAVVDEDIAYMNELRAVYTSYAYLLNAIELNRSGKPIENIKNNIQEVAKLFKDVREREAEYLRFEGLTKAYEGIISFLNLDFSSARSRLENGLKLLESAKNKVLVNPSSSSMIPAITKEITNAHTMLNLSESAQNIEQLGEHPSEIIKKISQYMDIINSTLTRLPNASRQPLEYFLEMSTYLNHISNVKLGNGFIKALPGSGDVLLPFWVVKITYTFTTGMLFAKKGKSYSEDLLVCALAPYTNKNAVTDIFKIRAESTLWERMSGKEKALTQGIVTKIISAVKNSSSVNRLIPPIVGKKDAEEYANSYLNSIFRILKNKIKFSMSEARFIVYIPSHIHDGTITPENLQDFGIIVSGLERLYDIIF